MDGRYIFRKAKAVWLPQRKQEGNCYAGFYTEIFLNEEEEIRIALAAQSYYRLYINGEHAADGPARTAAGYCRVDELRFALTGKVCIALEVIALDKPEKYSNDCTLEHGMAAVEITGADGRVISASGDASWKCQELKYRRMYVELMSHSRGITEWYDLGEKSFTWRTGEITGAMDPVPLKKEPLYLRRRSPYPDYKKCSFQVLRTVSDRIDPGTGKPGLVTRLSRQINPEWYGMIPEENCFLEKLERERDGYFSGSFRLIPGSGRKCLEITPGCNPCSAVWSMERSDVGFIEFTVTAEEECTLDLVNSDSLSIEGEQKADSFGVRFTLKRGTYHLMTAEPKLARYIRMIFRTRGKVRTEFPALIRYTYPDRKECWFECSDGELNQIYQGARETLRMNTLDIFMDCPQRERGGWLCDSHFTSAGAWQMFGDLSVEKDFIENFMLTDPGVMKRGFFPEVYPGSKKDRSDPGILNWSFWLVTELAEFYERSGDDEFLEACRERVSSFIEGLLSFRGESGLLENMETLFVDWSLSNSESCLRPISVPVNALAVRVLETAADLYGTERWKKAAQDMKTILKIMDERGSFPFAGDGAVFENGILRRTGIRTESGIALELWSGFHADDREYMRYFIERMGYSPEYRADPAIGRPNLFIGLMIRFDVLFRIGEIQTLLREMKDIYLPELIDGPGTLFEGYQDRFGCHGFNAAAGSFLTAAVLGLGAPCQRRRTVKISPHPGKLLWACGSAKCRDGEFLMEWSADQRQHILDIRLQIPEGWKAEYDLPFELSGWIIRINGKVYRK